MPRRGPTRDFDDVLLKWQGVNLDGTVPTGKLELTYNRATPLLDDDATSPVSIYPTTITKVLTTSVIQVEGDNGLIEDRTVGYASFVVPATDDPDIQGSGGTYTLVERLDNGKGQTRTFVASKDAVGGLIWLNRITSVTPVPGEVISAVSVTSFNSLSDRVQALEISGVPTTGGTPLANYSQVQALDGYPTAFPAAPHEHTIEQVQSLDDALGSKSDVGHSHLAADVTNFVEAAQDAVAQLLQGASGVSLTYDDAGNKLTITGGGAGGLDAEAVRDAIGVAIVGVGPIQVLVNDTADTITITLTGLTASSVTDFAAAVDAQLAATNTPWEVYAASGGAGAYPARPATARPIHFYGLNQPTTDGSVSGGGGMVPNKDQWFQWQAQ